MEVLWVEVKLDQATKLFVGIVYMPKSTLAVLDQLELSLDNTVAQCKPRDNILVFGDFNCRDMHWCMSTDREGVAELENKHEVSTVSGRLIDITDSCALTQHNTHPTCNGNQLDLVLSTDLKMQIEVTEKATNSTHGALEARISINHSPEKCIPVPRIVHNYKKTNWELCTSIICLYMLE